MSSEELFTLLFGYFFKQRRLATSVIRFALFRCIMLAPYVEGKGRQSGHTVGHPGKDERKSFRAAPLCQSFVLAYLTEEGGEGEGGMARPASARVGHGIPGDFNGAPRPANIIQLHYPL